MTTETEKLPSSSKSRGDIATRFKPGNTEWMRCHNPGRPKKYSTGDELWTACLEYIDWAIANPRPDQRMFSYQGKTHIGIVEIPRALIQRELCQFLGISISTWENYGKNPDLLRITEAVNDIMYVENFQWAAIGVLKENLIARTLGLAEQAKYQTPPTSNIDWSSVSNKSRQKLRPARYLG